MSPWLLSLGVAVAAGPGGPDADGVPAVPVPPPLVVPVPETAEVGRVPVWQLPQDDSALVTVEVALRRGLVHADDPLALLTAGLLLDDAPAELAGAERRCGVDLVRAWCRVTAPAVHEAAAVQLAATTLAAPRFSRRAVRRLRRAAVQERRDLPWTPGPLHALAVQRALYAPDHPLGQDFGEAAHRRLRRSHLRRAWRAELALGSPTVVAVGGTGAGLLPAVEDAVVALPAAGAPPPSRPALPLPAEGPHTMLLDQPGMQRALVSMLVPLPEVGSEGEAGVEVGAAAEVLVRALAADDDSRLARVLREEHGWAYAVAALEHGYDGPPGGGHRVLEIRFAVAVEDLVPALAAARDVLAEAGRRPLEPAELERVVAGHRRDVARQLTRTESLAVVLGRAVCAGRGADRTARNAAGVAEVEASRVLALAADLGLQRPIVVVSGDRQRIEPLLDAAGAPLDAVRTGPSLVDGALRRPL